MPIKSYLKEISKTSPNKMRANWELGIKLKLGDVGKMENGVFVPYTSLEKKGIIIEDRKGKRKSGKLDLSSEKGIKIHTHAKLKGDAEVIELNGELAYQIEFTKANTFVFRAEGIKTDIIINHEEIEEQILKLYKEKKWNKDYVIVTSVTSAESITILLSGESGVTTSLSASGKFNLSQMDIANASIGFGVSSTKKLAIELVGEKETTPLYKVRGLVDPLLGVPELESMGAKALEEKSEKDQNLIFKLQEIPFANKELED